VRPNNVGTIWEVFERAGGELTRPHGTSQMVRCIFHDDSIPSAKIYKEFEKFICFACRIAYTATQFWQKYEGKIPDKNVDDSLIVLVNVFEDELRPKLKQLLSKNRENVIKVYGVLDLIRVQLKDGKKMEQDYLWNHLMNLRQFVNEELVQSGN